MRIGFSYWGFCEPFNESNIAETPDGHRYGRPIFVKELKSRGHYVLGLQEQREKSPYGVAFSEYTVQHHMQWNDEVILADLSASKRPFSEYFPDIDVLFVEWRWATWKNEGLEPHEPDLKRQTELLDHYHSLGVPIIAWDTDLRITPEDERRWPNMVIADPSFKMNRLTRDRVFVPFWTDFEPLFEHDPQFYSYNYTYVGNNYGREEAFAEYYARPAGYLREIGIQTAVFGNWLNRSPERKDPAEIIAAAEHISFGGRHSFKESMELLSRAICTTHITKPLYNKVGFASPRYLENVVCGTPALVPAEFPVRNFLGAKWTVNYASDVVARVSEISKMTPDDRLAVVMEQRECLERHSFNVSHVCDLIESVVR